MTPTLVATVIAAIFSGMAAIIVALLANIFTVRRERESDWRRLKLTCYQEFIGVLSEVIGPQSNQQTHARYANAINNLTLVAPDAVLAAFYLVQDEIDIGKRNSARNIPREFQLLLDLVGEIRKDVTPGRRKSSLSLRLFGYQSEQS